jgi:histidinol-phosphatase (PHP family)
MKSNNRLLRVSAHGGHSGEFCLHAKDTLVQIVETYADQGFAWLGLTEHMPPMTDVGLYPDEKAAGITAQQLQQQFDRYVTTARQLQKKYAKTMAIFVAMETEFYAGSVPWIQRLKQLYQLDYLVGSVHHVMEQCFDFSRDDYTKAVELAGGYDALYYAYFDAQFAMINHINPAVVGHFDLIRLHDADYVQRFKQPEIWQRIERNLQLIAQKGLLLDFNVRALAKGASEPYVSAPILKRALELGIDLVPGDDSHGVASVGVGLDEATRLLTNAGYHCRWRLPV